jgi:sulfate permease, SulP family
MLRTRNLFPVVEWLPAYKGSFLPADLLAGITLACFVLPESMAYAGLAGVPPVYGIYCCILGGLLFAIFTNSRQVAVGPTSAISLMVGTTVAVLSGGDPAKWAAIAALTAFAVFIFCVIAYLLKLSILVNFISENILMGFKAGAALSIASTQLPKLFGVEGSGHNFFERIYAMCLHLGQTNTTILLFGLAALALLIAGNRIFPGRPVSLAIVILSILAVTITSLSSAGLHQVGEIPAGLPRFSLPSLHFSDVDGIFGLALGCFLMGYVETISAARTFAEKNGYEVDARQELLALGGANLATAFGSGYPVSGGLSQSTVNDKAGAKSPLSLVICSVVLCILLLFFTGLLKNLPEVILAVVVIDAVAGLIKVKELRKVYSLDKTEFWIAMIALTGVLFFGILNGILIAVISSLVILIARASQPNIARLGRIPGTGNYSDISRHPDNEEIPGCQIFRIEFSLLYFNQQSVYSRLRDSISKAGSPVQLVIIDMSSSPIVDISGSRMLVKLSRELEKQNISLKIIEALSEVRELLRKQGMEEVIGHISRKYSIDDVVREFRAKKMLSDSDE